MKLDLQSQKTSSLLNTVNIQSDKFVYRSDFKTTVLAFSPSTSFNSTLIQFSLHNVSNLNFAKFTTCKRTDVTLQTCVKEIRACTICSTFSPDCWFDNSNFIFIGNVFCPKTMCSGIHCIHKKTYESLLRSASQRLQCTFGCQVHNFCFEEETNSFFLKVNQGFRIFAETQRSNYCNLGNV